MNRIQDWLSAVLMAAMLCPALWAYGGAKKQGGALTDSPPSVPVRQGMDLEGVDGAAELVVLDANTCPSWEGNDRQQAQALFARLKERGIAMPSTFYRMLGRVTPAERGQMVGRCRLFFDSVDTQEIASTCCLTSMLKSRKHLCSFLTHSDDAIRRVARTPALKSLTSLFHGRGFPHAEEDTQAFIEWELWWQGEGEERTLDRDLLRIFSSMFSGKGLPDKKAVDDYLQLDIWWQSKDEVRTLDRKLLHIFSSMFSGRGLPDKKAVEDYLQRDIWWRREDGVRTLDRKLLRTFSSMFSGWGLPDKRVLDNYLTWGLWWQGEGEGRTLDRELLQAFSSMFSGRGLPDNKAVQDYLQWELWWQGEGQARVLDRKLLHTFSSMFSGRGFPDKKAVEDYLQCELWWHGKGDSRTLDRELLRTFSSMLKGKGLPEKYRTDELVQWLTCEQRCDKQAITIMASLYAGIGVGHKPLGFPDINKLRQAEQQLMALIPPAPDGECDQEKESDTLPLIKRVALYLANEGGAQQLSWTDCQAWVREYPRPRSRLSLLRQLLLILDYHGGQGIKGSVALISGKPLETKWFVLDALGSGQALTQVQYALQNIKPTEWWEYLSFTRGLDPLPSSQEWCTIKGYLEALAPVLPHQEYRRRFLSLIWPLPADDRERFIQPEAVGRLITFLPSALVMGNLLQFLTTDQLKILFDTCLTYREGLPDKQGLPTLFKVLLFAQQPLLDHGAIPEGLLAQPHDMPGGVVIGVNPVIGVEDPVTLFVYVMAALTEALWECTYVVDGQTLTLWPHGDTVPITFPTPFLVWHPDGVQIRHWTSAHLHRFYQAMGG